MLFENLCRNFEITVEREHLTRLLTRKALGDLQMSERTLRIAYTIRFSHKFETTENETRAYSLSWKKSRLSVAI
jgi:hypothetical protein